MEPSGPYNLATSNKANRKNNMKRLILTSVLLTPVLVLLVAFFAPKSTFATTYYVATSGSDSNNGTSESTAWAHLPGMPTATSLAGSYSALAGDALVLRGCDVWYTTPGTCNFPLVLNRGASSGN